MSPTPLYPAKVLGDEEGRIMYNVFAPQSRASQIFTSTSRLNAFIMVVEHELMVSLVWLPRTIFFAFQNIRNPFTGMPITVRVAGSGHFVLGFFVFQQFFEGIVDNLFVRTDEL